MKKLYLILLALAWAVWANHLFGCDRSAYSFNYFTFDGTNYTINTTVFVGGGIIGSTYGADDETMNIEIRVYGDPQMVFTGFSPDTMVSDTTSCPMHGIPFSNVNGANFGVNYQSPGCFYTCIHSTSICGRPHTDFKRISLTMDMLPDSMRVFGLEASGNPIGGCHPRSELLIDFTNIFPVTWTHFQAQPADQAVNLRWGTAKEVNNDHFRILRADRSENWEEIGQLPGAGNSDQARQYRFRDNSPLPGFNQYKIVQVDLDGRQSESQKVGVQVQAEAPLALQRIYPNPSTGSFDLEFYSSETTQLLIEVFDPKGQQVYRQRIQAFFSKNHFRLVLSDLNPGVYFLRVTSRESQLTQRLLLI